MSWLNALPVQPAISVRFRQRFLLIGEVLGLLEPVLNRLDAHQGRLRVGTSTPWDIDLEAPGGFTYRLRRDGLRVQFSYENVARDRLRKDSRQPTDESRSQALEPVLFAELLERTLASADDLLKALASTDTLVDRFGLEAAVPLKRGDVPPGVGLFLQALGALPGHEPIRASCQILSRVGRRKGSEDRVHYDLQSSENGDDIELLLDFQRYFKPAIRLKQPGTMRDLVRFIGEAVAHFEHFGSGDKAAPEPRLRRETLASAPSAPAPRSF